MEVKSVLFAKGRRAGVIRVAVGSWQLAVGSWLLAVGRGSVVLSIARLRREVAREITNHPQRQPCPKSSRNLFPPFCIFPRLPLALSLSSIVIPSKYALQHLSRGPCCPHGGGRRLYEILVSYYYLADSPPTTSMIAGPLARGKTGNPNDNNHVSVAHHAHAGPLAVHHLKHHAVL